MATFQIKYWFESNSRERTGEMVTEFREAEGPVDVAHYVRGNLAEASFVVEPGFGPATAGLIVINAMRVRYVEIVPYNAGETMI